jgi:hypothetical protein
MFARHCIKAGAKPDTLFAVADHALGTPYEGKIIGKLENWT